MAANQGSSSSTNFFGWSFTSSVLKEHVFPIEILNYSAVKEEYRTRKAIKNDCMIAGVPNMKWEIEMIYLDQKLIFTVRLTEGPSNVWKWGRYSFFNSEGHEYLNYENEVLDFGRTGAQHRDRPICTFPRLFDENLVLAQASNDRLVMEVGISLEDGFNESSGEGQRVEQYTLDEPPRDVVFIAGKHRFRAHREILAARSAYFAAMFRTSSADQNVLRVKLRDASPEIFPAILQFIYTDDTSAINENARNVLAAAERFKMPELKSLAQCVLISELTTSNVCEILILAEDHNALNLKECALQFITSNAEEVISTNGWLILKDDPRNLIGTLFEYRVRRNMRT